MAILRKGKAVLLDNVIREGYNYDHERNPFDEKRVLELKLTKYAQPNLHELLDMDCLKCALNQVIQTSEIAGVPEPQRREMMEKALKIMAEKGIHRNNCEIIADCVRVVTEAIGDDNPYREIKSHYNRGIMAICPELREHIAKSDDRLAAAVRAAIAGNLIDLGAQNLEVSLDLAMDKVHEVDEIGMYIDDTPSLKEALAKAKTLLVLGDNCGEIALDRVLIETIRELYPQLKVQYGVRGKSIVNDVTRDDAAEVGMEEVAEIIDNGDGVLSTLLYRTSEEFNRAFYDADVIIAKGMGNFEGLCCCDRKDIWFCLMAKCPVIGRITDVPKGSILCIHKDV